MARIFEEYADKGSTISFLVDGLNREGVPSPTGRKWGRNEVYQVLTNEAYRGARVWNKRTFQRGSGYTRKKANPPAEWIVTEDAHEAIISRELWARAQEIMKARGVNFHAASHDGRSSYLFSGIAKCSACGSPIAGCRRKAKGKVYRNYICSRGYNTMTCTKTKGVSADAFEEAILHKIKSILMDPEKFKVHVQGAILQHQKDGQEKRKQTSAAEKERERLDRQIQKVVNAVAEVGISPALTEKLKELEARKSQTEAALQQTERITKDFSVDEVKELMRNFHAHLESADCAEKKVWLKALIPEMTFDIERKQATFTLEVPVSVSESLLIELVAGERNALHLHTKKHIIGVKIHEIERVYF